ncbi:hypothetical protein K435DRAFT_854589 [Dendrothele bispora CBS 962.96]|uniref:Uncharacterized protein n=1 Tax=Dendrothele bispora (strain CBS 962.96) TaxID=1314807 RepID=A0A4S8MEX8_DENBC|nr:hypothetical protein K435DRAFT_854589 [Dendrothele bispora CBS 962.96]
MTTTISEELLSLHRGCNPKQLTKISNVLQVEKDIEAFHSAILESPDITSNTAHILRESVVFPGNDYIGDDPAIESTHASAIHYSSAHHFVRRFWYGIIPVDGKVKFQTAENPGRDICLLFIECRSADISMAYLTGCSGSTLASLLVQYRGKKKPAYVADYSDPGSNEDDYNAGGVREQIDMVIKDVGLEGQIQPMGMIDLLIRKEFPLYSKTQFYLENSDKSVALQDIISSGLEKDR